MDTVIENKENIIEKVINNKKTNSKKKKDTKIIIFNGKNIENNCIQIEGFTFRLLDEDIRDVVKIEYIKDKGNIKIVKIN